MRINEATRLVRSHEYPTTTTDLITAYGERTLQLANGDATLGDALRVAGEETYPTASDAEAALMCGLGHAAIGRRFYSDRDAYSAGEEGPQQVSF
jgi:hypothetical protein